MSSKQRLSASVDTDLVAVAQEAVARGRAESISAWVNEALRLKADHDRRLQALDDFLAAYEAEHGEITEEEIREATRSSRGRAVERGDREVVALVKRERLARQPPVTSGGVVAQVWRGGRGKQVQLARLLAGTEVAAIDDGLGRRAGMLLAGSGQSDAIDATVVCLAGDGDEILTSDPGDLRALAEAADVHVDIIPV